MTKIVDSRCESLRFGAGNIREIIQPVYRTAPCNLIVENIDGTFPTKPQSLEVRPVSSKAAWDKIQSNILVCTHLALIGSPGHCRRVIGQNEHPLLVAVGPPHVL